MAFDFPASPTNGQVFTPPGGPTYVWNGSAWAGAGFTPVVTVLPTAEARNRIVNPAMQISQELGDSGSTTAGAYVADQWLMQTNGMTNCGAVRLSTTPTVNGSTRRLFVSINTLKASIAAGDYHYVQQLIEGVRLADMMLGTANAKPMVLRFTARSNTVTGTFCWSLRNNGAAQSYVGDFSIPAINTDYVITAVIPPLTAGTWPIDNSQNSSLTFCFVSGSTYQGAAGINASNKLATANISNGASAVGAFTIADVGLYADPNNTGIAPPWQMPDEAQELAACMRYWEKGTSRFDAYVTSGFGYTTPVAYKAQKRINPPAIAPVNVSAGNFPATAAAGVSNDLNGHSAYRISNATGSGFFIETWAANARM